LFLDMKANRVINVLAACCELITDETASTESVIGCCSIIEKLTRNTQGVQLLSETLCKVGVLQALLPFSNPFHCLKRLRPHLLTSADAQLSKLSSVFVVAIDLCKTFCRVVESLASATRSTAPLISSTVTNALLQQPQQSCLHFSCLLASDVLVACCRRDASTQICALEHWAPCSHDLPSSHDALVLKLTLAMNVPISLAWVHELLQLVIVMYDCSALQMTIVPPIALSIKSADSVEAALHALSETSNPSIQPHTGAHDASDDEKCSMSAWGLSKAVFSMCVSVICCDLTSCEGAKVVIGL
jgi:hypothetical protein